jgi:hypothetical protein
MRLRLGKKPGASSEPRIALPPIDGSVARTGTPNFGNGIQIHAIPHTDSLGATPDRRKRLVMLIIHCGNSSYYKLMQRLRLPRIGNAVKSRREL